MGIPRLAAFKDTLFLAASFALVACSSRVDLASYAGRTLAPEVLSVPGFSIQALKPRSGQHLHLRIYIEGDGHAWATASQPSTDPTPHASLMLELASADKSTVAYLARPCQFVMTQGCDVHVWTDARFSRPEVDAMNGALSVLKQQFSVDTFELVGHSGGGAMALVLAGMRNDVTQVQTLGGNVDPLFWTQLHHLDPLSSPVVPLAYRERLKHVRQRLIVGRQDTVVPPSVARSYQAQAGADCLDMISIDASHVEGYASAWVQFSDREIRCTSHVSIK